MDVLGDGKRRTYTYISRYGSFPYYYHTEDDKYFYGITSQLSDSSSYVLHNITQQDSLDSLSYKYYGRPDLYWVIADFNRIQDPYVRLWGKYKALKIPTISNIEYN